jgi:hypothetical protein
VGDDYVPQIILMCWLSNGSVLCTNKNCVAKKKKKLCAAWHNSGAPPLNTYLCPCVVQPILRQEKFKLFRVRQEINKGDESLEITADRTDREAQALKVWVERELNHHSLIFPSFKTKLFILKTDELWKQSMHLKRFLLMSYASFHNLPLIENVSHDFFWGTI